ncbi:Cys-tRNA(Pro) deacylase, prolyl-tRNA editing enzyme YbaK/EbsC [Gemmobacter megaterium]|uniref:Cys-tRNA(Pro) deacylase, prolyl-tRNA editing enzyme YbaK/EbsC n=1 Tax=Gemmobacter megaterium TaxID=1086013 RepID=A0A1N7KJJ8_9RHOB|nr:YbaK/EbsC family protein [Gemmobacter megaterium]GGE02480.1 aminoacyl-tRNA deacylase [Gemmobacter megaterium]SIS61686.1 Cys-tRNA(Pro) deacylase, prolyl-tRNA editing enzyme YbaK/EbsC [Gemmobacter megaterium]
MSSSLDRVKAALAAAGVTADLREMPASTRTAAEAAAAADCQIDQIAKSIIFKGLDSGHAKLFLTAGGNQVDAAKASALAGEPLGKADAALIRAETGFAIGGVAPVGHLTALPVWIDPRLFDFPLLWAAAGTPRHIFSIDAETLVRITGAMRADFTT